MANIDRHERFPEQRGGRPREDWSRQDEEGREERYEGGGPEPWRGEGRKGSWRGQEGWRGDEEYESSRGWQGYGGPGQGRYGTEPRGTGFQGGRSGGFGGAGGYGGGEFGGSQPGRPYGGQFGGQFGGQYGGMEPGRGQFGGGQFGGPGEGVWSGRQYGPVYGYGSQYGLPGGMGGREFGSGGEYGGFGGYGGAYGAGVSEFGGPMPDRFEESRRGFGGRERGQFGPSGYSGPTREYRGGGGYSEQGRGFAGRAPKGYQRSDDRIKEDVNEELTRNPDLDPSEVTVQVRNGEVTLAGTVEDRHAKRLAEELAEQVSGVKEVTNQLRMSPPRSQESGSPPGEASGREERSRTGRTGAPVGA